MIKTTETYKYLTFSNFKNLGFWDYYSLSSKSSIQSKYQLVELEKVLSHRKEFIVIGDKIEYKRCRVQLYGKGIILRDQVRGSKIKTKKQQLCKENDFLVAEIDAKFGGYGIVPKRLVNAIVSGHYFLFDIDNENLMPDFLGLLVKCNEFSKQVKATGSTNYAAIRPYHVLNYLVPLPPYKEQARVTKSYNRRIQLAEKKGKQAKQIEQEIENYLLKMLGVTKLVMKGRDEGLQLAAFKDIGRWSVDYISKQSTISVALDGKYKNSKFEEFMLSCQYGLSLKSHKEAVGVPMLRMSNIFDSEVALDDVKYINIAEDIRQKYLLAKGDLLFNRTNSKELVGKTAVFEEDGEYTFASYIIRVKLDSSKVNTNYINYLFNSSFLKYQKDMISRQILGQANINSKELQDFLFPLPPLKIQNQIAEKINQMKMEIKDLQLQAEGNREKAMQEFEEEIFSKK